MNRRKSWAIVLLVGVTTLASAMTAKASSVTYTVTGTSPDNETVKGSAAFVVSNGSIAITLTNLTIPAEMTSAGELLTGLTFTISGGKTVATYTSGVAPQIYTLTGTTPGSFVSNYDLKANDEWRVSANSLSWNDGSGPDHGIIGTGPFPGSIGGVSGNGPHNPVIDQVANFVLSGSVLSTDTITSATLYWGTGPDATKNPTTTTSTPVPVPAAVWSGMSLLAGMGLLGKLRRKNRGN
jgi:hypothetical protein